MRSSLLSRSALLAVVASVATCLAGCEATQPSPPQERVQAVAAADSAPLAQAPASKPAAPVHQEAVAQRDICDRQFAADKAPKVQWPPPGGKPQAKKGPVWVNLWAAWCKPCVAEIPELRQWAKDGNYAMYFVSLDDDDREWKQGVEKLRLSSFDGSVWLGPGKTRTAWLKPLGFLDVPNLPAQVLLDAEHRLRCFRSGAIESTEKDAFERLMHSL